MIRIPRTNGPVRKSAVKIRRQCLTALSAAALLAVTGCQSVPPGQALPLVSFLEAADVDSEPPHFVPDEGVLPAP